MSWQTIVKENNLQISSVLLGKLNEEFRLDAEYYRSEALVYLELIENKKGVPLSSIAKFVVGPFGSTVTVDKYVEEDDYSYVRNLDINDFVINAPDAHISKELFGKLKQFHIQENDLLVTVVGTLGKVAIARKKDTQSIFSCKSTIIRCTKINPFFIATYLNSKIGQTLLLRCKRGAIQEGLNLFDVRTLQVAIPTVDFQQLVENKIRQAFTLFEQSEILYKNAEQQLLKAINLINYKPSNANTAVRSLAECLSDDRLDAEYWQPKYKELKQKLQKIGSVPLESVFELIGHPSQADYVESGNIPVIAQKHLGPELALKSTDFDNLTDQAQIKKTDKKYLLKDKDILVCSAGAPGQTVLWREKYAKEAIGGSFITVLRGTDFIPEYIALFLASLPGQMQFQQYQTASVQQYVYPSQIKKILIPKLKIDIQKELAKKISKSHQTKEEAKNLIEKAKRAVEIFIEQDEKQALAHLNQ